LTAFGWRIYLIKGGFYMASGQTAGRTQGSTGVRRTQSQRQKNNSITKETADKKAAAGGTGKAKTSRGSTASGKTKPGGSGQKGRKTSTAKSSSSGNTGGRRSNSGRQYTGRKYTKEELARRSGMYDEVRMIIALAVSVIILISTLDFGGRAGAYISDFVFGTFGVLGYVVPFIIFFGTAFMLANRKNKIIFKKIVAFFAFFIFLMAFLQMLASPFDATTKILDYYKNCAVYKNGGGIIGGTVCYVLNPLLGKAGCYVIIVIGMALGIVFMAQRAVFSAVISKFRVWLADYKEYRTEKKRMKEEMRRELYDDDDEDEYPEDPEDEGRDTYESGAAALTETFVPQEDEPWEEASQKHRRKNKKLHNRSFENLRYDTEGAHQPGGEAGGQGTGTVPEGYSEDAFSLEDFSLADTGIEAPAITEADIIRADRQTAEAPSEESGSSAPEMTVTGNDDGSAPEITVTRMAPIRFEDTEDTEDTEAAERNKYGQNQTAIPPVTVPEGVGDETVELDEQLLADTKQAEKATPKDTQPVTADEIAPPVREYVFPPVTLLKKGSSKTAAVSDRTLKETAMKLQNTLDSFGVGVQVTNVSCGPSVTRYELTPDQGVKVSKIVALTDDIKLNLAVADIRIEAPIPGKSAVGIEVPNRENTMVLFRDLIESTEFHNSGSNVSFAVGRDISGQVIVTDIAKMPHLLIAGATGSGKSVCINTLIMSIIYKAKPEDVRLIMVDPKVVELSVYNGIPHLLIPVVTDPKKAAGALNWAVMEMTDRYNKFAALGVRDIKGYNEKIEASEYESGTYKKMPQIVIIVDELADLMMVASTEVEDAICRLAQLARAAGIHLVIATQRPSVNVITGLIKANIPSRVAFAVSSGVDSRTIIDMNGAEKLLGKGDMLFYPAGTQKPLRVQGAFISDREVNDVVEFLKEQGQTAAYSDEVSDKINSAKGMDGGAGHSVERDVYFADAGRFIIEKDKASIGMLQRVYKIGFNRAARIMDQLCDAGVVGPEEGTKPRKVLMSAEEFENYVDEYV